MAQYCKIMGFTDDQCLTILPSLLDDAAFHTFESLTDKQKGTYKLAMENLAQIYGPAAQGSYLFSQLFNEKQLPGQSLFDYSNSVTDKLNALQMADPAVRLQIFVNGLNKQLKTEVIKKQPATLTEAKNYAALLESNAEVFKDDLSDLKEMVSDVKKAVQETKAKAEVDCMSLAPGQYPIADVYGLLAAPPYHQPQTNLDIMSATAPVNALPYQNPNPSPPKPRGAYPQSAYRTPVRPQYTSQPVYNPRFQAGFTPNQTYQQRPYRAYRPRYDQPPIPQRPYRPTGNTVSFPSTPAPPRFGGYRGPRPDQKGPADQAFLPFCKYCQLPHEYGVHVYAPEGYCTYHQSNTHTNETCRAQVPVATMNSQQSYPQEQSAPLN
jgi:hypothetical protein